ncbi:unnamed protein product [Clonostachys byssicola]|uniref:Uncharacterized protein n=1 Tax=Clonostachys byssicola TaxID=160290 RepID=A0A9N9UQE3_9HYPO|nr:unnamed protein product [Clonostachys byssicola]
MLSVATPQAQSLYLPQPFPQQPYQYQQYQQQQQQQHQQQLHHRQLQQPYFFSHYRPMPHRVSPPQPVMASPSHDAAVSQALEIARESPDGAQDPTISKILESALSHIWTKVQTHPDSYVMSRDEFAVFNFFQHRFAGQKVAVMAKKRYWDTTSA